MHFSFSKKANIVREEIGIYLEFLDSSIATFTKAIKDLVMHPILYTNSNQSLTCLQLSAEDVEIDILHIGKISSYLYSFFETTNITFSPTNLKVSDSDFDIVLVNNDSLISDYVYNVIEDVKLKVTYTKSYIKSGTDFIDSSLIPILLKYLIKLKSAFNNAVHNSKKRKDNVDVFLKKVAEVIDEHIDDHSLNMERLSNLLCMSRSAFSKKIKAYTGLKPTEYINEYKLEKSKQFLIITNWQISRISDVLGFSSQHYYCRLFKKKEGISPSQYRITHKTQ